MKLSDFSRCALGICAAAAIPAGCSGGSPARTASRRCPTRLDSKALRVHVPKMLSWGRLQRRRSYSRETAGGLPMSPQSAPPPCTVTNVTTVLTNQPPVCTVGPFVSVNGGIGVDQSGNLWVPDQGANPKTVTEYGPDCGPAETVLTVSGDTLPDNVAFDTNGHVYVANAVANSGGPETSCNTLGQRSLRRCRIPTSARRKDSPSISATTYGSHTGILEAPAPTSQSSGAEKCRPSYSRVYYLSGSPAASSSIGSKS